MRDWLRYALCRLLGHDPVTSGPDLSLGDLLSLGMRCSRCGRYRDPFDTRWRRRDA